MSSPCKKIFFVTPFSFVVAASTLSCFVLLVQCAVRTGNLQATPRPSSTLNNSKQHFITINQLYVGVAYSNFNEAVVTRAVNRTIATLATELSSINVDLIPLYAPLPSTFSAKALADICAMWENKTVVAVLVFASDHPGFIPTLAAVSANIPALWATGEVKDGYLVRVRADQFLEIRLDASALDLFRALRALLLATHWHSFTLFYTGLPLRREMADTLQESPLNPTFVPIRANATAHAIFGLLSDVSRSTKGVLLLMSSGETARRVMIEAKKLNMVEGNFVWLWIDTTASVIARNDTKYNIFSSGEENMKVKIDRRIRETQHTILEEKNFSSSLESVEYNHSADTGSGRNKSNSKESIRTVLGGYLDNLGFQHGLSFFENSRNINDLRITRNNKRNVDNQNSKSVNTNLKSNVYPDEKQTSLSLIEKTKKSKLNRKISEATALYNKTSENKEIFKLRSKNIGKLFPKKNENSLDHFHFDWFVNLKNNSKSNFGLLFNFTNRLVRNRNKRDVLFNLRKSVLKGENKRMFEDTQSNFKISPVNSNIDIVNNHYDLSKSNNLVIKNSDSKLSERFLVERSAKPRQRVKENLKPVVVTPNVPLLPVGMLAIRALPLKFDRHLVRSSVKKIVESMKRAVIKRCRAREEKPTDSVAPISCWRSNADWQKSFTKYFLNELKTDSESGNMSDRGERALAAKFQILNLVPESTIPLVKDIGEVQESTSWRAVGDIVGQTVHLDTVVWPGGDLVPVSTSRGVRSVFRVVTALNPPFVMEGELDEDGQCLRGLECHRLLTSDKDNLTLVFNEMNRLEEVEEEIDARSTQEKQKEEYTRHIWDQDTDNELQSRYKYRTNCCYGLSMDLLENIAQELEFDFHLYIVSDEMYGTKVLTPTGETKWNGIVGDLVSGAAHMSFAALSVSSPRSQVIDFSVPYFYSGVSFLAAPKQRTDIPLLAFLLPFSPELWIAIFTSLNVTAVAVAIYEWLSPFGLNPWGRQRSKNFSMSSALWVCWGLLCGHLVAFKAPKSWPNKFLINVWGGFSVIFVASYTANIAALIAGLFFHNAVGDYHDRSLLSQRVGTPRASAADYYVHRANQLLWEHMQRYAVKDVATGVQHLKNGSLDILIADTPILDYYRATDHGCKLQKIGDAINEDTYAVGMTKGFPLKDSISAVIAKYSSNGYMDILQEKWYGGLPCFKLATDMAQPRPLGVAAVTGVFLLLGMGMVVGCLILLIEHLFYKYTLPILRHKPKGTIWKSRNIMFFSQKLYRFINCVELVSPHHAARELVHTLRQGQITSLFQKSVKRKEHEQRRRRKSKAQFFEMIQEIRRVQQEERVGSISPPKITLPCSDKSKASPRTKKHSDQQRRHSRLDLARRLSKDVFRSKSSSNLSIRRLSSDINMAAGRFLDCHSSQAIGRRLSRDTNLSPPDINSRRASHLSVYRKTSNQFLSPGSDLDSGSDISVPKSPVPLSLSAINPKSPDCSNTSRFSYVDIKSPSFKNKLSRFKDNSLPDCNPKVIVHHDDEETTKTKTRDSWANTSDSATEHLIEIIIPSEDKRKTNVNKDYKKTEEPLKPSRSLTGLSLLEQISTLSESHGQPETNPTKPKIVSYLPKKHPRNPNVDTPHKKIAGKKDRRRSSSDLVLRVDADKRDSNTLEKCQIVSADCIKSEQSNNSDNDAFKRLSKDELLSLLQIPERELKQRLLQAIQDRDPT